MRAQEAELLAAAMAQSNGVQKTAANLLGLSYRQLRYLLQKHGLRPRDLEKDF